MKEDKIITIALILLVTLVGIIIFCAYSDVHAPCSDFAGVTIKNLPARCINYFK